jgi:hypothetical protein
MVVKEILMTTIILKAPTPLNVVPISDTEWRVSDPACRSDDARCVVGFVQQIDRVFEATRISTPTSRSYFSSLSAAIAALASPHG